MTSAVPSAPTCMIPIPTIPTMPSAHGMTSAVCSAPTMLPMPTIQTTPQSMH